MLTVVLRIASVMVLGLVLLVDTPSPLNEPVARAQVVDRPNILVIMTDDQNPGRDGLSVMNGLNRIYRDGGTYFPNAVVTTPLCCPSRASIFSGRYAHNHKVQSQDGSPFNPQTSLQYHLKTNLGYKTALTGNKYLQGVSGRPPYIDLVAKRPGYYKDGVYQTDYLNQKAVSFLNTFEQTDAAPWLMYVNTTAPHEPWVVEKGYENAFVPPYEETPARNETNRSDKHPYVSNFRLNKATIVQDRASQIRTLYSVDDMIEGIFGRMDALGETQNTIAFFLTDNGYLWYDHGLKQKRHLYQDSVKTPFFVRWPGHFAADATDNRIVANIDIAATVYDILDYSPGNYAVDGKSLFTSNRDHILLEYWKEGRGGPPTWKGIWTPQSIYAEYLVDGFREYYAPDDPWQLDNGFKTGDPPSNATELSSILRQDFTCSGAACP